MDVVGEDEVKSPVLDLPRELASDLITWAHAEVDRLRKEKGLPPKVWADGPAAARQAAPFDPLKTIIHRPAPEEDRIPMAEVEQRRHRNFSKRLTDSQRSEILQFAPTMTAPELARCYGVTDQTIRNLCDKNGIGLKKGIGGRRKAETDASQETTEEKTAPPVESPIFARAPRFTRIPRLQQLAPETASSSAPQPGVSTGELLVRFVDQQPLERIDSLLLSMSRTEKVVALARALRGRIQSIERALGLPSN